MMVMSIGLKILWVAESDRCIHFRVGCKSCLQVSSTTNTIVLNGVSHCCKIVVPIQINVLDTTQECLAMAREYAISKQCHPARLIWAEIDALVDRNILVLLLL